jgi:hypothetical protein
MDWGRIGAGIATGGLSEAYRALDSGALDRQNNEYAAVDRADYDSPGYAQRDQLYNQQLADALRNNQAQAYTAQDSAFRGNQSQLAQMLMGQARGGKQPERRATAPGPDVERGAAAGPRGVRPRPVSSRPRCAWPWAMRPARGYGMSGQAAMAGIAERNAAAQSLGGRAVWRSWPGPADGHVQRWQPAGRQPVQCWPKWRACTGSPAGPATERAGTAAGRHGLPGRPHTAVRRHARRPYDRRARARRRPGRRIHGRDGQRRARQGIDRARRQRGGRVHARHHAADVGNTRPSTATAPRPDTGGSSVSWLRTSSAPRLARLLSPTRPRARSWTSAGWAPS